MSHKDSVLSKLSNQELLGLAKIASGIPIAGKTSRSTLIEMIKYSMSIEEIKKRTREIRTRSRHSANLRGRKLLAIFLVSVIVYSILFIGATLIFSDLSLKYAVVTPAEEEWSIAFGRTYVFSAVTAQQAHDGEFVVTGTVRNEEGSTDAFLLRLNSIGAVQLNKTYGGHDFVGGSFAKETSDGGYLVGGYTNSLYGNCSRAWLMKTDSGGNIRWNATLGTGEEYYTKYATETSDGGYVAIGYEFAYGTGDISNRSRVWFAKINATGEYQWGRSYRVTYGVHSAMQTSDGGYIIVGTEMDGPCLLKIDTDGNVELNMIYANVGYEMYSVHQTYDGGYVLAGATLSQAWIVKTDPHGNIQWSKTYGESGTARALSALQTFDGGYIIAGHIHSQSDAGNSALLIKMDPDGNIQWSKTYGGSGTAWASSVLQISTNRYVVAGGAESSDGNTTVWIAELAVQSQPVGAAMFLVVFGGITTLFASSLILLWRRAHIKQFRRKAY